MDFEKYKNKVAYPDRPRKPVEPRYIGPHTDEKDAEYCKATKEFAASMKKYADDLVQYREDQAKYSEEGIKVDFLFQQDAIKEVGLVNHPKASKIFAYAWEEGHAGGYSEVFYVLDGIKDLFKD
jgi:hypothetical protein